MSKAVGLGGSLTAEQVAVRGGLLHDGGVDSIALLKDLLGRRPLVDEAGDPRSRAGFLVGLADAVKEEGGGNGSSSDVEAALLSGHAMVSQVAGKAVRQLLLCFQTRVWSRSVGEMSLRRSFRSRARGRRESPSGAGCAAVAASK